MAWSTQACLQSLPVLRLAADRLRKPIAAKRAVTDAAAMIVTATANAKGEQRLYLGGKASLECWIEPDPDGHGWSFHVEEAVTGNNLTLDDKRDFARHMLESLAALLETSLTELWTIPYSRIIALHCPNPFLGRRAPSPRKQFLDQGFIPIQPQPTGPPVANSPRLSASPRRNSCR